MTGKKLSLFDIDAQAKELEAILETSGGDLDQEKDGKAIGEWIDKNEILHREKIGGYCAILKTLSLDVEKCGQMANAYQALGKTKAAKSERLLEALKQSMESRNIVRIDAPTNLLWIQKNAIPAVTINATIKEMPPQYRKTIPASEAIDTEKLRADALAGIPEALALCRVGEVGSSLRIK